jgi:predicted permease
MMGFPILSKDQARRSTIFLWAAFPLLAFVILAVSNRTGDLVAIVLATIFAVLWLALALQIFFSRRAASRGPEPD